MKDSRYYTLLGMMQMILSNQIDGAFSTIICTLALVSFVQGFTGLLSEKSKNKE